ncbi:MAG: hypothetical protein R3B09_15580 [Nannocystaceae bacterium]
MSISRVTLAALTLVGCSERVVDLMEMKQQGADMTSTHLASCGSASGLEIHAAEAEAALSVTWNDGEVAPGGYRVRWGRATGEYEGTQTIACGRPGCEAVLGGLIDDTDYYVVVDALDGAGEVARTSCELVVTPHVVAFEADAAIAEPTSKPQDFPALVVGVEGAPLFVAWEEGDGGYLARSDDRGDTWAAPVALGSGADTRPALGLREAATIDGASIPAALFVAYAEAGSIVVLEGASPSSPAEPLALGSPTTLGVGAAPAVAALADAVHVVYERDGQIFAASRVGDAGFGAEVRVDTGEGEATGAAIAVDPSTLAIHVAYQARRPDGDYDVYLNTSTDRGGTFGAQEVRVDDDLTDADQTDVSIAVDDRSRQVHALWKDGRSGGVYLSRSFDGAASWEPGLDLAVGLGGDPVTPRAALDHGRNAYVIFLEGSRPIFSRANASGIFDPPIAPSAAAGATGIKADHPTVAVDSIGTIYAAWSEGRGAKGGVIHFARTP